MRLEEHTGLGFSQKWTVALTELTLSPISDDQEALPESVIVGCDLAEPSYINGTGNSLLHTLAAAKEITASLYQPYYMDVSKLHFRQIQITLKDSKLGRLSAAKGWTESLL